ncbi:MAG: Ig-like domain-containing protein [Gemmatimonadota bacterium]|nr:Ig-like domain-containing protein [Gemmatimonadota bacterium]
MTGRSAWVRLGSIALMAGFVAAACTDSPTGVDTQVSVTITPATSTLASIGEQIQLAAKVDVSGGMQPSVVWITRDVDVAGVGDDGRVRAVGNGQTWIVAVAEAGGMKGSDSAQIVVAQVPVTLRVEKTLDTLTWLGATTRLTAVAMDALGNEVADARPDWSSSDATLASVDSLGVVTARANGQASISASIGDAVAFVSLAVAQQVADVTVTPGAVAISVGATQQFSAEARDAGGTLVSNVNFLWVSANANVAVVDTTGLATGTGVGAVTITAVGRGEPGNAVLTVGSTPATPTQVAFSVQPSASTAGQALSPAIEVEVRDASGNRVPTARNAVTLAISTNPGSGTLSGTKTVTAVNGIASFSGLWIDKAAPGYTLSATASGLSTGTSSSFTVNPGAPTKLAFGTQPGNVQGYVPFAPTVTATIADAFGNTVTAATNAVTVDFGVNVWKSVFSSGSMLFGTKTVNAVSGVATFPNLRVDKPGPGYALSASAAGLTPGSSNPFAVNLTVQQVRAAKMGSHTCAVTSGGPYCWGSGSSGQLGDSTGTFPQDSVPGVVRRGLTFTQIAAGGNHSCGLTAAGVAYCWGNNGNGQLGNNTTTRTDSPVPVSGGLTFSSLSAGIAHTCGLVGTIAYCWGYDGNGQLGDNAALADRLVPTLVAGGLSWASVRPAGYHTCGVTTGGDAYCWGADFYGQLGNDSTLADQPTPVVVYGAKTWTQVDGGYYHTCGVDASGAGWCWGRNFDGRLGADTVAVPRNSSQPTPRAVFGGLTWSTIQVGWFGSCGLTSVGSAYCWGYNYDGQLGSGAFDAGFPLRVAVSGGLTFSSLSVGGDHTCGRVGTAVWCWGAGYNGQLGNGSSARQNTPVQIVQ